MDFNFNFVADIVVGAVLLLGLLIGSKKGFIKTISGLIVTVASIIGARFLSAMITDPITSFVYPMVEESVKKKIDGNIIDPVGIEIVDKAIEAAKNSVTPLLQVTAEAFVRSVVHVLAFIVCTLVLSFILKMLVGLVDKVFDLPLLKSVNGLLGAVCGLLEAVLILFLVPYLAKQLGISTIDELSEGTKLLSFFVNNSPFELFHMFVK